jgi:hypothetical protein
MVTMAQGVQPVPDTELNSWLATQTTQSRLLESARRAKDTVGSVVVASVKEAGTLDLFTAKDMKADEFDKMSAFIQDIIKQALASPKEFGLKTHDVNGSELLAVSVIEDLPRG